MPVASMKDCSVVTATYDLGDGMKGTIGIIGPRRMDYERVVSVLQNIMKQLDDLYKTERTMVRYMVSRAAAEGQPECGEEARIASRECGNEHRTAPKKR